MFSAMTNSLRLCSHFGNDGRLIVPGARKRSKLNGEFLFLIQSQKH